MIPAKRPKNLPQKQIFGLSFFEKSRK